jgi:hypothetical protein
MKRENSFFNDGKFSIRLLFDFVFVSKGIIMRIFILWVNDHQNPMNLPENLVKSKYPAMNMIWEVVEPMVIHLLSKLFN